MKRAADVAHRRGLRRGDAAFAPVALSLALALSTGACGVSVPIASLVPDDTATGSIAAKPISPLSPDHTAEDWRRARGALAVALDPQGSGGSVSWENPDTGRKGSFVPAGQPFVKADSICRAFRAALSGAETTALQGTACRMSGPDWAIKDVKPARKPA